MIQHNNELLTVFGANFKHLHNESKAAPANKISLKEILKKEVLTVKRTMVQLTNICGYTKSRASNSHLLT